MTDQEDTGQRDQAGGALREQVRSKYAAAALTILQPTGGDAEGGACCGGAYGADPAAADADALTALGSRATSRRFRCRTRR